MQEAPQTEAEDATVVVLLSLRRVPLSEKLHKDLLTTSDRLVPDYSLIAPPQVRKPIIFSLQEKITENVTTPKTTNLPEKVIKISVPPTERITTPDEQFVPKEAAAEELSEEDEVPKQIPLEESSKKSSPTPLPTVPTQAKPPTPTPETSHTPQTPSVPLAAEPVAKLSAPEPEHSRKPVPAPSTSRPTKLAPSTAAKAGKQLAQEKDSKLSAVQPPNKPSDFSGYQTDCLLH